MHFAIVDNRRIEAGIGLKGFCPGCSKPVIAKCGKERIWHWAHRNNIKCDKWWESETDWHRSWKNYYPSDWQEVFLPDEQTGEKHMADVRTANGLVIEFQHSHINPNERISREKFYQNMVWIVDGTHLKRDYSRFLKGKDHFQIIKQGVFRVDYPEECFPSAWLGCSVPVIFDFQGNKDTVDPKDTKSNLYCLFPIPIGSYSFLAEITRKTFINTTISGDWIFRTRNFIDNLIQVRQEWQDQIKKRQQIQDNINFARFSRAMRYTRRGRLF
jgi:competence protein CoiA